MNASILGLEPEIQKLIAGHKAEMRKLKTLHEAEVAQADERAALKYTHEKELMRNNLQAELESACEKGEKPVFYCSIVNFEKSVARLTLILSAIFWSSSVHFFSAIEFSSKVWFSL